MASELSFGVGCFHFGVKGPWPFELTGLDYVDRLRRALEGLFNVDDVEIDYAREFDNYASVLTAAPEPIDRETGFFPWPSHLRLSFTARIPARLQRDLTSWRLAHEPLQTSTERFRISIRYLYNVPITFVTPIDPAPMNEPSDGVIVVREFLRKEFADIERLAFECLGPSPFHCDFFVRPDDRPIQENQPPLRCKRTERRGYDEIVFYFDPARFTSADDAADEVYRQTEDEFEFFYHLVQHEICDSHRFDSIQAAVSELVTLEQRSDVRGHWSRLTSSRKRAAAFIDLAAFQADRAHRQVPLRRDYRTIYTEGYEKSCIRRYVDEYLDRPLSYPVEELTSVLELMETRRSSTMRNLVTATSGLVGVGVGVLVTVLLSD